MLLVRAIRKHLNSSTLRFVWSVEKEFVVFDAVNGPCDATALGWATRHALLASAVVYKSRRQLRLA